MVHVYKACGLLTSLLLMAGGMRLNADPVTITGSVSAAGSSYNYSFSITNNSSTDPDAELVSIDFPSLPSGSVMGDAIAPSGYGEVTTGDYILFDSNAPSFPVGATTSGFSFIDTMNLSSISFEALYFNSDETQTDVFTGTVSPQGPGSATPEPGTWGLMTGASILLAGVFRKWKTGQLES